MLVSMLPLLALLMILLCVVVFERAHVSQCDAEMSDGNRWSECQPVRGAVCQPVYPHHEPAQTGVHTHTHTHTFIHNHSERCLSELHSA